MANNGHISRNPLIRMILVGTLILLLTTLVIGESLRSPVKTASEAKLSERINDPQSLEVRSFLDLVQLPSDRLEQADIAMMNLLCAADLPGSERLHLSNLLSTLDTWTQRVRFETQRHLYRFHRNRSEYENSEAYFRMLMMITVLQQDLGVKYSPERARNPDFRDSRDLFIHGLLGAHRTGTCMSMPVLYVAVGRRLGYPVKLAQTKSHLYMRWEDERPGGEKLNIEATGQGMHAYPDQHYREWPEKLTGAELASGVYVKSLSRADELSTFLQARGHCLQDNGLLPEAQVAYALAHQVSPKMPHALGFLAEAVRLENPRLFPARRAPPSLNPLAIRRVPSHETQADWVHALNEHNRKMLAGEIPPWTNPPDSPRGF